VFVPASVEQMFQLGPQLDYHRSGALVMGLSTWNSALLTERAGVALEGAIFPDDYPLYPAHWVEAFGAAWDANAYPPEADELALRSYQAMRRLLDTLASSGARTRDDLTAALRRRLSREELDVSGPESFGVTVRVLREQEIRPFPAEMFGDGWNVGNGASAGERPQPDVHE